MNEARRAEDVLQVLCNTKHGELDRRLGAVEKAVLAIASRPPVWASTVIALLSAALGFSVAR